MPFAHEKLDVYQEAIRFVAWAHKLLNELPKGFAVRNQLDRASTSVPLNIAEGNAKFSHPDRSRFFQIAHGSAVECAACLDVMVALELRQSREVQEGKQHLLRIVRMLLGLLKRYGSSMVEEETEEYGILKELIEDEGD